MLNLFSVLSNCEIVHCKDHRKVWKNITIKQKSKMYVNTAKKLEFGFCEKFFYKNRITNHNEIENKTRYESVIDVRIFLLCTFSLGKIYLLMKLLRNVSDKKQFSITRSLEQHEDWDFVDKVLDFDEVKWGFTVFDVVWGSKWKPKDPIFTKRRHENLLVVCLPQSYFDLP